MSERKQEAPDPAVPSEGLQAAGDGNDGPRARLPAHESLQADDPGAKPHQLHHKTESLRRPKRLKFSLAN